MFKESCVMVRTIFFRKRLTLKETIGKGQILWGCALLLNNIYLCSNFEVLRSKGNQVSTRTKFGWRRIIRRKSTKTMSPIRKGRHKSYVRRFVLYTLKNKLWRKNDQNIVTSYTNSYWTLRTIQYYYKIRPLNNVVWIPYYSNIN